MSIGKCAIHEKSPLRGTKCDKDFRIQLVRIFLQEVELFASIRASTLQPLNCASDISNVIIIWVARAMPL